MPALTPEIAGCLQDCYRASRFFLNRSSPNSFNTTCLRLVAEPILAPLNDPRYTYPYNNVECKFACYMAGLRSQCMMNGSTTTTPSTTTQSSSIPQTTTGAPTTHGDLDPMQMCAAVILFACFIFFVYGVIQCIQSRRHRTRYHPLNKCEDPEMSPTPLMEDPDVSQCKHVRKRR